MRLAGYRIHSLDLGSAGEAYTYVMAGNGLFLEAENGLISARALLARATVRGLAPLEPFLELKHGRVPAHWLALAINAMPADVESYASIVWDGRAYRLIFPPQERGEAHVTYETVSGTVVSIHSHGAMGAFFSYQDDRDEQGFQVSVVIGHMDRLLPQAWARLSAYGCFAPLGLAEVFTGVLPVMEG